MSQNSDIKAKCQKSIFNARKKIFGAGSEQEIITLHKKIYRDSLSYLKFQPEDPSAVCDLMSRDRLNALLRAVEDSVADQGIDPRELYHRHHELLADLEAGRIPSECEVEHPEECISL